MSKSSERFLKNYKPERIPDSSKKGYKIVYRYTGEYYSWDFPEDILKKYRQFFFLAEVLSVILFIFASTRNIDANKNIFVALPVLLSLCAWLFELIAIYFFSFVKFPLKEDDYLRIHHTFSVTFLVRFVCLIVSCIGCLWMLFHTSAVLLTSVVLFCYVICGAFAFILYRAYHALNSRKKITKTAK